MTNRQAAIIALLCISISGCQLDNEIDEINMSSPKSKGSVTICASLEEGQQTKTQLNGTKVVWCDGDEFVLLGSDSKDRFSLESGAGTNTGKFTGDITGGAPYYALYPYSETASLADGSLYFTLPHVQTFFDNSFGHGASPSIATMGGDPFSPVSFKNIFGALEFNLAGSCTVSRIVMTAFSDKPLWGDCALSLDGNQGTDSQNLNISGGSNELVLECPDGVILKPSITKKFTFIVPQGVLDEGFFMKIIDTEGNVSSFLSTQAAIRIKRSKISSMKKVRIPENGEPADTASRGYFNCIFQDSGCGLSHYKTLPAATMLGLGFDTMATAGSSKEDSLFQYKVLCGDETDLNGAMLYPDDEPRYRMVYVNGGGATSHAISVTSRGKKIFNTFVDNGGSYVGSCAGAFITSTGAGSLKTPEYFALVPQRVVGTGYNFVDTGLSFDKDCPLLKYYDFGGDYYVADVAHRGGCMFYDSDIIPGLEILARFDIDSLPRIHGKACIWAYKPRPERGRVLPCGSHPEQVPDGERRDLMASMILYAIDGNGNDLNLKGTLNNGEPRVMDQLSTANKPKYARVGDQQYHHFNVNIPEGAKDVKVSLTGDGAHNLHLALRKGAPAWRSEAQYVLVSKGTDKELTLDTLAAGEWYISVYCPTVLSLETETLKFDYTGDTSVLNGVPYTITVSWN